MKLSWSNWLLLKYKPLVKLNFGHRVIHKQKPYTHLVFGLFIRRFFSMTVKKVYNVSFDSFSGSRVHIQVPSAEIAAKYNQEKNYKLETRTIWKRQ